MQWCVHLPARASIRRHWLATGPDRERDLYWGSGKSPASQCGSCPMTSRLETQLNLTAFHLGFQSWAGHSPATSGASAAFSSSTTGASPSSR